MIFYFVLNKKKKKINENDSGIVSKNKIVIPENVITQAVLLFLFCFVCTNSLLPYVMKELFKNKKQPIVSPKGSAYNLVCRLMDKARNLNSNDNLSTLIPTEISDDIGRKIKYMVNIKKHDYEKQFMVLNIYYDNDSDIKKLCENIRLHKKESLKYALNTRVIWKLSDEYDVNIKEKEPEKKDNNDDKGNDKMKEIINKMKIMKYHVLIYHIFVYEVNFNHVRLLPLESLKLEFRSVIKQEWAIFEPLKISLRMVEFNKELNQFTDSIIIQVEDGKIGDLRRIFTQTSDKCANNEADSLRERIFLQKDGIGMLLSDEVYKKIYQIQMKYIIKC